ncbi:MAG: hypothetical protein ACXVDZ_16990 [Bacteroidia bacterium]
MSEERKIAINKHFGKKIKKFKKEALSIAMEFDYPYIEAFLQSTIIRMKHNAKWAMADIKKDEMIFSELD